MIVWVLTWGDGYSQASVQGVFKSESAAYDWAIGERKHRGDFTRETIKEQGFWAEDFEVEE